VAFEFQAAGTQKDIVAQLAAISQEPAHSMFARNLAALIAAEIQKDKLFEHNNCKYIYTLRAEGTSGGGSPLQFRVSLDKFWVADTAIPKPQIPQLSNAQVAAAMQTAPVTTEPPRHVPGTIMDFNPPQVYEPMEHVYEPMEHVAEPMDMSDWTDQHAQAGPSEETPSAGGFLAGGID
jgi:hypothetical protein